MAQADSVPSSSRQLITGESANQSTNLRAVTLPAVKVKPTDSRYLVDGSNARVITGSEKAPFLRPWREKRGDERADRLKCRYGANACQTPVASNVGALCYANAALFLARLLRRTPQILLLFVSRTRRLPNNALNQVSSNQLVPSRPQERLR
jgi:hypothetical protein